MAALVRPVVELAILVEDRPQLRVRDADPGVPDLDAEHGPAPPAAEQHRAAPRVFQRVGQQVANHLLQQPRVAAHRRRAPHHAQADRLRPRLGGEVAAQPVQQVADREGREFGAHDAGLDLVDVEQRVQHPRHRAQRVAEARHQAPGGLALDDVAQQALQQRHGLQRLAQVVAGGGEEARPGGVGQVGLLPGPFERLAGVPAPGDVAEGDDHALDPAVVGAVRQDAAAEPGAARCLDLTLDRRRMRQHRARVVGEQAVAGERAQVGERAADVALHDREQRARRRGEEADAQLCIEEQHGDIGAAEHVLQVVGRGALLLQGGLKPAVQRAQLLVERLQRLLRGRHRLPIDRRPHLARERQVARRAPGLVHGKVCAAPGPRCVAGLRRHRGVMPVRSTIRHLKTAPAPRATPPAAKAENKAACRPSRQGSDADAVPRPARRGSRVVPLNTAADRETGAGLSHASGFKF